MQRFCSILLVTLAIITLFGCSATLDDYQSQTPELKLEEFFKGKLVAYGMFQDRSNQVMRRFRVDMTGTWEGNTGILDETFYYQDGTTEKRVWTLTKLADGKYSGSASDVIGEALGETSGFALNWHYTLALKTEDDIYHVDFDDWMYLLDDKRLINRATVTKWGFHVGEVTLLIEKL